MLILRIQGPGPSWLLDLVPGGKESSQPQTPSVCSFFKLILTHKRLGVRGIIEGFVPHPGVAPHPGSPGKLPCLKTIQWVLKNRKKASLMGRHPS